MNFILDDVLSRNELIWLYNHLLDTPAWSLSRISKANYKNIFSSFPGLIIQDENDIKCEYLSGYFRSTIFKIERILKNNYSFILPNRIVRIHLGAKSSFSKTEKHIDCEEENYWTILGFLNPIWNNKDGGEFYLENKKIDYKPGRFIVFPSNIEHDGGFVKNEKMSYWRIAANIIMGP